MKHLRILAAFLFVVANCGPAFSYPEQSDRVQLNVLYQHAWRVVRENYYKPDFNGQDWNRWKDRFSGKLESIEDAYKAIETMTSSLNDPFVQFIRPTDVDSVRETGSFFGVGMQLGVTKEKKCFVLTPIPSSPASTAGVKSGWEVIKIDGMIASGLPLTEIAKRFAVRLERLLKLASSITKKR
jgi:Periplasmic protease